MKKILLAVFFLATCFVVPGWAHKVNLFCYLEGNILYGESYFSGGRPAQKAKVDICDETDNSVIVSLFTDDEGKFSFPLEKSTPLKVVLYAGQGHKTEFSLVPEAVGFSLVETLTADQSQSAQASDIEAMIDRKLKPLHTRIALLEKKIAEPSLAAILGGIGWIVGILALLYFWKRNKNAS